MKRKTGKKMLYLIFALLVIGVLVDLPSITVLFRKNPETEEEAAARSALPRIETVWADRKNWTAKTDDQGNAVQVYNPFLPLNEYIPDGEPHVFGDRVYLYGSHDQAGSDRFCVQDYTVWSAPIDDLTAWTNHGVSYRKDQDPRSRDGALVDFYAPDCVQGNDGRYYLYYFSSGPNTPSFGPMSVAVSDHPDGPFEYLGDIQYPDGTPVLKYLTNDPAVINDDGRIWLYYGWGLGRDLSSRMLSPVFAVLESRLCHRSIGEILFTKPSVLCCAVVEMEDDMITVKGEPKAVLDSKTTADKKDPLYYHPFYEAASIRKIGDLYYLIYSCEADNALAYATSSYPDRDFIYRGLIISNTDLGYFGNTEPKAPASTIHGSIENINGQYYVFYHRSTNNTDYSRQACAEPIEILPDGSIKQVEVTSCGLNGGPLAGHGTYPAAICCNLTCPGGIEFGWGKGQNYPRVNERDGETFVCDLVDGTELGYKYFDFTDLHTISVTTRGTGEGILEIRLSPSGDVLASVPVHSSDVWSSTQTDLRIQDSVGALYLRYVGSGKTDLLDFTLA